MMGEGELFTTNQLLENREDRRDEKEIQDDANNAKFKELVENLEASNCRLILHTKNIGSWLTVQVTKVTVTVVAAT